jgi:BirA family biotin operon repressor/biotin-[acetyl-CoA-carboxylase] ligase
MIQPSDEWQLETRRLGRRVMVFDRLESTNTHAASLADDPGNDGLVILAREQTGGRGQHGRSWHTPAGQAVLMSVLLSPPSALRRPVLLAAWAAVAVCETVRRITEQQAKIKWPNDVLVRGKKVCGILIEQARGTVAGVGLNVNQSAQAFAEAGLPDAGSLAQFRSQESGDRGPEAGKLDVDDVARLLIHHLDEEYDRLCSGDLGTLESCWKWHSGLLGKDVEVECHDANHHGRLLDMSWDGIVIESGGGVRSLYPESVKHIREARDA